MLSVESLLFYTLLKMRQHLTASAIARRISFESPWPKAVKLSVDHAILKKTSEVA